MLQQYIEAIEKSNIISRTDTAGIITFVNDEFCKISGYSKEELIGKITILYVIHLFLHQSSNYFGTQ